MKEKKKRKEIEKSNGISEKLIYFFIFYRQDKLKTTTK